LKIRIADLFRSSVLKYAFEQATSHALQPVHIS